MYTHVQTRDDPFSPVGDFRGGGGKSDRQKGTWTRCGHSGRSRIESNRGAALTRRILSIVGRISFLQRPALMINFFLNFDFIIHRVMYE